MSNPPGSAPTAAVFLSYASQDADAARRLGDALRAAGIAVWLDQSELRGGDAWDTRIRRQIRECALFVPIISTHTQQRLEGYYRLEWKLAIDRSHLMAEERIFFVPVVIDATADADAKVPDKFREVQWTRLPDGEPTPAFIARLQHLLDGRGTGLPRHDGGAQRNPVAPSPMGAERRARLLLGAGIVAAALVMIVVGPRVWRRGSDGMVRPNGAAGAGQRSSEAQRLAEQARRHFQGIFTRADLAMAEELGRRAAEMEPTLALAWSVQAGANACYLMRGFVAGDAAQHRARDAQTFAARALAIDRNETEALLALGQVAMFQAAPKQAEAFYRRVMAHEPDNPFARRYLSIVLRNTGRVAEAIALMQDAVRRHPRDTLTHFDLALAYTYGWDWPRAWEAADAALAIEPFPGALMLKVRLALQWKGDVALIRQLLDTLELTYRSEDDAVVWDMRCGLFERAPEKVLEAAGRTARTYLEESFIFPAPKAWFTARAYELAGKPGLAAQHWRIAAAILDERLKADPENLELRLKLAVTLAWLKDTARAQRELATIEAAWRDQLNPDRAWDLASFYAASGDADRAVPLLRQALHQGTGIAPLTVNQLKLDPWWDEIRAAPAFQALLTDPPPVPAPILVGKR